MHLLLGIIITAALCLTGTFGTTCYNCNSATPGQRGCEHAENINNWYQDCSLPGQNRCLKVVGPGSSVVRSCAGIGASETEGCLQNGGIQTCICYSNYCNSAQSMFQRTSVVLLTVLVCSFYIIAKYVR